MWRLADHENYIALDHIRSLLALSLKHNLLVVFHPPFNLHPEGLTLLDQTLTFAARTLLSENFTFALTSIARLLHLHLHHAHVNVLDHLA